MSFESEPGSPRTQATLSATSPEYKARRASLAEDARVDLLGGVTRREIANTARDDLGGPMDPKEALAAAIGGDGGVVIPAHQVHQCLEIVNQAADYCTHRGQPDLGHRLRLVSKVLLGADDEELPVLNEGFALGDEVEVRYMLDDEVNWDLCKIAPGSGGGIYTVEFENGEIWDHVPRSDLRRPLQPEDGSPRALTCQPPPKKPNTWDLATRDDHLMYSGWTNMTHGLMQRKTKYWTMLIGTKLYWGDRPDCESWESMDLAKAKISVCVQATDVLPLLTHTHSLHPPPYNPQLLEDPKAEDDIQTLEEKEVVYTMQVVKAPDYDFKIEVISEYEKNAWFAQLRTAALRGVRKPDYTAIVEIENELQEVVCRPVLPLFEAEQIIEKKHMAMMCGYIVCSQGSTWWGSHDWKRRWVVLHHYWLCIRPDKSSCSRNIVIPLRETKCWSNPIHNHPNTLEVTGPWVGSKMLCFDDEETCDKWKSAITSSIFASNPEDITTDRVIGCETEDRGIA